MSGAKKRRKFWPLQSQLSRSPRVGPFDLSVSLGHAGQIHHPCVLEATQRVIEAAAACGVPAFMPVFAPEETELKRQVAWWSGRGVRHFAVGADKIIAAHALKAYRLWAAVP